MARWFIPRCIVNRGDIKAMAEEDHGRPTRKPLFLRLDEELRRQLIDKARESDRSLTGEINNRLRKSLRASDEAAA
jgi:TraY domain-containing protein